jgi:hypothetical protein
LSIIYVYLAGMKAKYAISLLVFGYCLDFIGALLKILHTAGADFTLTIAVVRIFLSIRMVSGV